MGRVDVRDPETGKWACWSTIVDDYVIDWLPETEYKAMRLVDYILSSMKFPRDEVEDNDFMDNFVTFGLKGDEATFTVKNINRFELTESSWYTKLLCDAKRDLVQKCLDCTHNKCDDCINGDCFEPAK